ncbi:aminotransferase class V-fold PLP-dependent enzyme [Microbacterium sp. TNHR37B]|uniref:aminotransferase class V-fold PLP-dependent enzyme n=1 Tax=Microbacterium sp. TNHR37B TaxID=1775956 RepID=UPI0007B19ED0|nr:aminotransferase class V-fold PLP-dependent enzyme [Microbacterium sp. TNHR37B]KZE91355.1 Isopenicillin N epimerase [Microbacterium sp. TNHR37B]
MSALESFLDSFDEEPGYLNWPAFGPLSPTVLEESRADAQLLASGRASGIALVAAHRDEARRALGDLLGVPADEISLQPSTTYGLMHALFGLTGTVLVSSAEYPALPVTARRAHEARGRLHVREFAPADGMLRPEALRDALTADIDAVLVSLVDYRTGYTLDLSTVREVIGDRLLIVDAVQAVGVVDADYAAADVLCGNGYKWLRAGYGTGFVRFSPTARERIEPVLAGFAGLEGELGPGEFGGARAGADAFTVTGTDSLAAGRLAVAVSEVVDAGVAAVAAEVADRARHVMALADRYQIPVLTPREAHSGIVALEPEPADAGPLAAALANHGVTATARGGVVRLGAHAGTGADTLQLLGDALAEVAARRNVPVPPAVVALDS